LNKNVTQHRIEVPYLLHPRGVGSSIFSLDGHYRIIDFQQNVERKPSTGSLMCKNSRMSA